MLFFNELVFVMWVSQVSHLTSHIRKRYARRGIWSVSLFPEKMKEMIQQPEQTNNNNDDRVLQKIRKMSQIFVVEFFEAFFHR
ncbi:MAG: hypothetical protein FD123_2183 [Bacteroidetes bacterium]|nr:MAG: hypothetical protein FD123_2183 [Bacteroidota bacterium]